MFPLPHILLCLLIIITQHWGLVGTGSSPPDGYFHHATDKDKFPGERREPGNLWYERKRAPHGMLESRTAVVALRIGPVTEDRLHEACGDGKTRLMNHGERPEGDDDWTCRGWASRVALETLPDLQKEHGEQVTTLPGNRSKSTAKLLPHIALLYIHGRC